MTSELHDSVGAYVLDALDDLDRVRFEKHLLTCEPCQAEVVRYRETLARLAFDHPLAPPVTVRQLVFAAVADRPQFDGSPVVRRRPGRRLAWAVAAGLVVAVGTGGVYLGSERRIINAIKNAPDAAVAAYVSANTTADVMWSEQRAQGVLAVHGLPALPAGQDYQVWVIGAGAPVPAGTFDTSGSSAEVLIGEEVFIGAVVAVTVEPAGGSTEPSSDPILVIQL